MTTVKKVTILDCWSKKPFDVCTRQEPVEYLSVKAEFLGHEAGSALHNGNKNSKNVTYDDGYRISS